VQAPFPEVIVRALVRNQPKFWKVEISQESEEIYVNCN
jgi:hypothetical protein